MKTYDYLEYIWLYLDLCRAAGWRWCYLSLQETNPVEESKGISW